MTKQELKKQILEDKIAERLEEEGYVDIRDVITSDEDMFLNMDVFLQALGEIIGVECGLFEREGGLEIQKM